MTIDEFTTSPLAGDCRLLKRVYEFDKHASENKWGFVSGLTLLDLEPYGGTFLYDPSMTPVNSIAFATTGGDDVHFGLIAIDGKFGDASPVIVTVPMAGDGPENASYVVGKDLHDFLCLGCVHGFFELEKLAYRWRNELFSQHAIPPSADDEPIYARFRAELSLVPWVNVESRLQELDTRYRSMLRFGSHQ